MRRNFTAWQADTTLILSKEAHYILEMNQLKPLDSRP